MIVRAVRSAAVRRAAVAASVAALLAACSTSAAHPGARASSGARPVSATPSVHPAAAATTPAVTTPAVTTPAVTTPAVTTPSTTAPPNPCRANTGGQLVKVSIREQHLWMCQGHTLVRDTPVTTGIPGEDTHTPTGTYTVQARTRNTSLTLISGQTYAVRYWIPFDAPLFGFHDSSWQTIAYGSRRYRTDGSHGCVHVPVKAIAFLYRWAHVGAKVRIRA